MVGAMRAGFSFVDAHNEIILKSQPGSFLRPMRSKPAAWIIASDACD
jgi:hypothetical protein